VKSFFEPTITNVMKNLMLNLIILMMMVVNLNAQTSDSLRILNEKREQEVEMQIREADRLAQQADVLALKADSIAMIADSIAASMDELSDPASPPDADMEADGGSFSDNYFSINKKPNTKNVKIRWLLVDLGLSTYLSKDGFNLPQTAEYEPFEQNLWKSTNWNLHLMRMRINIYKHVVNLQTGLGFEFYRYNWTNNYDLPEGQANLVPVKSGTDYDKNRMHSSWVTVPLMVNFETNPNKTNRSFHFSVGGYAAARLGTNIRQEGPDIKDRKLRDDFNQNNFRYGLTSVIGYGPISVFANYSLVPLFKTENTAFPELYPFNFGICLIPF